MIEIKYACSSCCWYHPWGSDPSVPHRPRAPWKPRCFSAKMGRLMHVLVVADAELPLTTLIPPMPFAAGNTSLSAHFVAFLGSLSVLPPPAPFASSLSLGFCKFGCHRRTQSSTWYVSNVSIIFYAPCLFLHHLLSVLLHFVAFLCIFRN
jgi:hypothetical protein